MKAVMYWASVTVGKGWDRMWSRGMCCGHCVSLKKYVAIIWLMDMYKASMTQRHGKRDWKMDCVAASQAFVRSRGWKYSMIVEIRESW